MPPRSRPPRGAIARDSRTTGDFVRRLDTDGDGQVSRRELDGPAEHFHVLDTNGDGYLSADEAPRLPPRRRPRSPVGIGVSYLPVSALESSEKISSFFEMAETAVPKKLFRPILRRTRRLRLAETVPR